MTNKEKANYRSMGVASDSVHVLDAIFKLKKNVLIFPEALFDALKIMYGTKISVKEMMSNVKQKP